MNTGAGESIHPNCLDGGSRSPLSLESMAQFIVRPQIFRLGHAHIVERLDLTSLYVMTKGVAALQCQIGPGPSTVTDLLYPGDVLVPKLEVPTPGLTLTAQRPVEFWKVALKSFQPESACSLWQSILLRLGERNARSQLHIAAIAALDPKQRIAGFLVETRLRLGCARSSTPTFELPLSRCNIAARLALNADTVSRTFSALVAMKIIKRHSRVQITICDWNALVALCPLSGTIMRLHDLSLCELDRMPSPES